jgi:hypothetical protein
MIHTLWRSEAAQHFTSNHIRRFITAALQHDEVDARVVLALVKLSEADILAEAVLSWLHSAVESGNAKAVKALCRLQAAEELEAEQVAGLLTAAVQFDHEDVVVALASSFQAANIEAEVMLGMMNAAVVQDSPVLIEALCSMRAAEQVTTEVLAVLLKGAVHQQQLAATAAHLLCCIAQRLQQQDAAHDQQLLGTQVLPRRQQRSGKQQSFAAPSTRVTSLQRQQCQRQLHGLLKVDDVLALLQLALQQGCTTSLELTCGLALVRGLLGEAAATSLMQYAIVQGQYYGQHAGLVIEGLCSLTAMQQLQPKQVVSLLLNALQCDNTAAVQAISSLLPAGGRLAAASSVMQLLQVAEAKGLVGGKGGRCEWFEAVAVQLRRLQA